MSKLVNRTDKRVLKQRLQEEQILRKTISFYRYVYIPEPEKLRDELFEKWTELNCFGRIYLAHEGINAQMSVPADQWEAFELLRMCSSNMPWIRMARAFIN
jgi:UPF0176 protein